MASNDSSEFKDQIARLNMFKKILIANRGEIACRVAATAKRMGIQTVAVYSDADAHAKHVAACDEAIHVGGSAPKDSYLRWEAIIEAAKRYMVTAERFSATQAHAMGMVHELCTLESLDAKVAELVSTLCGNGPQALRACKKLVQDVAGQPIDETLRIETARRIADIRASDEGKEGLQSFLQKRPAQWTQAQ